MKSTNKLFLFAILFVCSFQTANAQAIIDFEYIDNFFSVENVLGGPYQMCINDTNLRNTYGYLLDTTYEIFIDSVSIHNGVMQDTNPCFLVSGTYNFGFGYQFQLHASPISGLVIFNDSISLDLDPFYQPPLATSTDLTTINNNLSAIAIVLSVLTALYLSQILVLAVRS